MGRDKEVRRIIDKYDHIRYLLCFVFLLFLLSLPENARPHEHGQSQNANELWQSGMSAFTANDYRAAEKNFSLAVSLFNELGDRQANADILSCLALIKAREGEVSTAIVLLEEAKQIYSSQFFEPASRSCLRDTDQLDEGLIMLTLDLVMRYYRAEQYENAIARSDKLLSIAPSVTVRTAEAYANLLAFKGLAHGGLEAWDKAAIAYQHAILLNPAQADAYYNLGSIYIRWDRIEAAEYCLKQAINAKPDFADAYFHLGEIYRSMAMFRQSRDQIERALSLYEQSANRKGIADSMNYLAGDLCREGRDVDALNAYQRALTIYRELQDKKGQGKILNDIAGLYSNLKEFGEALSFYQEALRIFRELNEHELIILVLGNMANIKFDMAQSSMSDNYADTISIAKEALKIAEGERLEKHDYTFVAYKALGLGYWFSGEEEKAIELGRKVLEIYEKSGHKTHLARIYLLLGQALDRRNDAGAASKYYHNAARLTEELDDPFLQYSVAWGLGRIADRGGNLAAAKSYYFKAIDIIEKHREETQSLSLKISLAFDVVDIYNDTILFLARIAEHEEAFNYAERARARSLLDLVGNRLGVASQNLDNKDIFREERRLQLRILFLADKLTSITESADDRGKDNERSLLKKELEQARIEYGNLMGEIKKKYPEISALLTVSPLTLKEIQALVEPETTMLAYFVTPQKTLLWIVGNSTLRTVEINITEKELHSKINEYREQLTGLHPNYQELAGELYALLIQPAKPHIKTTRVAIIPHSVLHYLPFQALLNSARRDGAETIRQQRRYLVEEYDIFYAPSASVLQFVYQKRKSFDGKILAFANPTLEHEKTDLPFAESEVRAIRDVFPEASIYLKGQATETKAKDLSKSYNVLHFATHGELNSTSPLLSNILLAQEKDEDGKLDVYEIFNLDLKSASLVTLSACETGLGKLTKGDELIGLTRAFLYAGAPSIVASLWKVNDESTAKFMALFYKNLKAHSKAEALRLAQVEMIRGIVGKGIVRGVGGITTSKEGRKKPDQPATVDGSHPYFWAPFILVGDWK